MLSLYYVGLAPRILMVERLEGQSSARFRNAHDHREKRGQTLLRLGHADDPMQQGNGLRCVLGGSRVNPHPQQPIGGLLR
jgi:hypothetical protein